MGPETLNIGYLDPLGDRDISVNATQDYSQPTLSQP